MPYAFEDCIETFETPLTNTAECTHTKVTVDKGEVSCSDCGTILSNVTFEDKQYGNAAQNHYRANHIKGIHNDVVNLNIPIEIENFANDMYLNIVRNVTQKGDNRKGIICSCLKYAYMYHKVPMTMHKLTELMRVKQRHIYKGTRMVSEMYPELTSSTLTAYDLIPEYAGLFSLNNTDIEKIQRLSNTVIPKSTVLKRSKPQSVAAGLIYFYITLNKMGFTKAYCSKTIGVSEITLQKIAKTIVDIHI